MSEPINTAIIVIGTTMKIRCFGTGLLHLSLGLGLPQTRSRLARPTSSRRPAEQDGSVDESEPQGAEVAHLR